jgi:hypothetical protein
MKRHFYASSPDQGLARQDHSRTKQSKTRLLLAMPLTTMLLKKNGTRTWVRIFSQQNGMDN